MPGLIINIQADNDKGNASAKAIGDFIADIVSRQIGDDVRVNASDTDNPMSSAQQFKTVNEVGRRPWKGRH